MFSEPISSEEKRRTLERVLESRAFSRSDQLRAFLRYVCEAEFEGRAQQLNEYALGVSVLGRPADYSPAEDSCVRTRAYELRNRLRSYYRTEAPDDPIQIEIDKGAYVPRFERRVKTIPSEADEGSESVPLMPTPVAAAPHVPTEPPALAKPAVPKRRFSLLVVAALVIAVLLVAASFATAWRMRAKTDAWGLDGQVAVPEMDALWKPFLDSHVPLLISFDIRLFLFAPSTGLVVRDYRTNQMDELANSKPLTDFQERMGTHDLQATRDYADFGAVHAAFLLGRLFASQHRDVGIKHSGSLGWEDVWNANLVFIGKPNLNPTVRYSLQGRDFVDTEFGHGIRNLHPLPGEPEIYITGITHGEGEKYALITVLPGPQPGHHIMILSGSGAELMWALAEAVTNPTRVKDIMAHVLLPSGKAPTAFQVVIAATFESNVPVKIHYVSHRVSKAD
jgi:hypothetical protein